MAYSVFNTQVDEFMKNIIEGFQDMNDLEYIKKEFRTMRNGFSLLKQFDEKKPMNIFITFISKHRLREKILKKDESFFLDTEYNFNQNNEYWSDFINNIKKVWVSMSNESKENMWKYFQLLIMISEKV